jgi:tetratricopeptide (TPR) repeat protein
MLINLRVWSKLENYKGKRWIHVRLRTDCIKSSAPATVLPWEVSTMKRLLPVVGLFVLTCQTLQAQVSINAMEKEGHAVRSSTAIHCLRYASLEELSEVGIGLALQVGDELTGSGSVGLELRCGGGSLLKFSGGFRVLIAPAASGQDCAVNLLKGSVNVMSNRPTGLQSGETTLGSKGTIYSFSVEPATGQPPTLTCGVYEGSLDVNYPATGPLTLGTRGKMQFQKGTRPKSGSLVENDFKDAADLYARVDRSKAELAGVNFSGSADVFEQLSAMYAAMLRDPDQVEPRIQLATLQVNNRIRDEALYNLDVAEVKAAEAGSPAPSESRLPQIRAQQAQIALLKAVVFQGNGQGPLAVEQVNKALVLDPGVLNKEDLKRYRIDELQIMQIKPDARIDTVRIRKSEQPADARLKEMADVGASKASQSQGVAERAKIAQTATAPPSQMRAAPTLLHVAADDVLTPLFTLIDKGTYQEALNGFMKRQQAGQDDARVNYGIALSLSKMSRDTDAVPYAKKALQLNDKQPALSKTEVDTCRAIAARRDS